MKYKGWIPPRRCLFFRQWIYFTGRSYTTGDYI